VVVAVPEDALPPGEEVERVLRARAVTLALRMEADVPTENRLGLLEFGLAGERFGIDAALVKEVCPLREVTFLPGAPTFIAGITNYRSTVLSVLDLRLLLGLSSDDGSRGGILVVLSDPHMIFGLIVDEVLGLTTIATGEMETGLAGLRGPDEKYVRGATAGGVLVLDGRRLLAEETLVVT
jgi:purine-binding chemotaxis protein CheW